MRISTTARVASQQAAATQQSTSTSAHTSDSYSKEVDSTPPNDPKIHRVDPDSDTAQKSYEAPRGKFSETGVKSAWERGWKKDDEGKK
ncbi:hypothetical protein K435DRAFT_778145 [Dendrothele bispora CBS 962.96]|uniref:Uncharacterized protein n=1 Tax=Dendrothele bispora (strain CBS 962.96) TaxID=1314807 RepID=A0A4S8M4X8_DENBC|nr:hypothetical protein K435DRAFT_778145 [Dendrothele bispora CBS 962.96]